METAAGSESQLAHFANPLRALIRVDEKWDGKSTTLLLGSGVFCNEQLNERTQQRFASPSHVVHELEKAEIKRQFLLGNASMRAQPTAP